MSKSNASKKNLNSFYFFTEEKYTSEYNELEAKKPKFIYKRCEDCPSNRDR